jgi:hypothetical protein
VSYHAFFCLPILFLVSVCQLGCQSCAYGTGDCITCAAGFTQDGNDRTKCDTIPRTSSTGSVCPDGSFSSGTSCAVCSPLCTTCFGPNSNQCIICGSGTYMFNGSCVTTNVEGVCSGSNLIANNNKHECDSKCVTFCMLNICSRCDSQLVDQSARLARYPISMLHLLLIKLSALAVFLASSCHKGSV